MIAHINSSWCVRVRRDDLVTFQVDGTHGSAVAGLTKCWTQHRVNTPRPVWNPDVPQTMNFHDAVGRSAGQHRLRKRLQAAVGRFHPPCRRRHAVASWLDRGRQGRAACRAWPAELGRTALARRAGRSRSEGGMRGNALSLPTARPAGSRSLHHRRADRRFPSRQTERQATSTASPMRPRMSSPIRSPTTIRGSTRRSTGTRPSHFRHYLWDLGLGVAEAMDTAQRGGGLDWPGARELIRHTLEAAKGAAGREDLLRRRHRSSRAARGTSRIDDIIRAYEEQIEAIEAMGGQLVVMASRALAARRQKPGRLRQSLRPHSARRCASRSSSIGSARCSIRRSPAIGARPITPPRWRLVSASLRDNAAKIDGVKISLLRRKRKSRCAAACRRACACIPATTSTTPS